jgi:hypothetical protein
MGGNKEKHPTNLSSDKKNILQMVQEKMGTW